MKKHFACTACGKCCYGLLPLTLNDAFANVSLFPIGIIWTPVLPTHKDFAAIANMGTILKLPNHKEVAVSIVPTSFVPSTLRCPALLQNNLCGIHADKPLRCKTMPFFPYRDEKFQAELLNPRDGWECDISEDAPVVYEDRKIVFREDFDREKAALLADAALYRRYAQYMLKYSHTLLNSLMVISAQSKSGYVVTSFSSLLTALKEPRAKEVAKHQVPVLQAFVEKTASDESLKEFHGHYSNWLREMSFIAKS